MPTSFVKMIIMSKELMDIEKGRNVHTFLIDISRTEGVATDKLFP